MQDLEILEFYRRVRDPNWPDIQSYSDFCKLPTNIKDECTNIHGLELTKSQILDQNHWICLTQDVYTYKNLAYIPIPKCAYVYYTTFFTSLNWEKTTLSSIDIKSTKFFGTIMHPMTRWLKGVTEWLTLAYAIGDFKKDPANPWLVEPYEVDLVQLNLDLESSAFKKLIGSLLVSDMHSMPYSAMFGNLLNQATWIPMDIMSDNDVKIKLMNFFSANGHDISIPLNDKRLHESPPEKLKIFNYIKDTCFKDSNQLYSFYKLYSNDLKFYYNLVESTNN